MRSVGCTPSRKTRVWNSLGVALVTLRSKIKLTRSGRPRSRLSRIKFSTKAQPCSGSRNTCVRLAYASICQILNWCGYPAVRCAALNGQGICSTQRSKSACIFSASNWNKFVANAQGLRKTENRCSTLQKRCLPDVIAVWPIRAH